MNTEEMENMAGTLFAISIVAKKLGKEILAKTAGGEKDVKNKAATRNKRRSRKFS